MKKLVVLTGHARGIGKSIHSQLSSEGYEVIGLDVLAENPCDITQEKHLQAVAEKIGTRGLTALVHCAAIQIEKKVQETTHQDLVQLFDVNLFSLFSMVKHFEKYFLPNSAIVTISSVHAKATSPKLGAYAASKAALSSLTRTLALELGPKIRVNAICPGAIDTEMLRQGLARNNSPELALEKLKQSSPLQRIGTGADVANLVSFLVDSEKSKNITGQEFYTDSGIFSRLPSE